jgi:hypothetical protein
MKAFTSMGIEDGQDGFMPMMQGMMKSLLSKDILYPIFISKVFHFQNVHLYKGPLSS